MKKAPGGFTLVSAEAKLDDHAWLSSRNYELITDETRAREWCGSLGKGDVMGADWETDRLNRFTGPLPVGLALSKGEGVAAYLPIHHITDPGLNLSEGFVEDLVRRLDGAGVVSCFWNYIYDSSVHLKRWKLELANWEDAMVATWVHNPSVREYGLKASVRRLLGTPTIDYESVVTGRKFQELSPREATAYPCSDADHTRAIWLKVSTDPWFKAQENVYRLIEKPFLLVLRDEVDGGCVIDVPYFEQLAAEMGDVDPETELPVSGRLKAAHDRVMARAGRAINLSSTAQIAKLLTDMQVPVEEKTDGGQLATGAEVLAKYAAAYPICKDITDYRKVEWAKANIVDKLLAAAGHFGSPWAHFPFKQCGAPTGRMACGGDGSDRKKTARAYDSGVFPINAQAIPTFDARDPVVPDLRRGFIPCPANEAGADEWVWVALDYGQLQLRIATNFSGEPYWVNTFRDTGVDEDGNKRNDIHLANARAAYGARVGKDKRDMGKTMNFATLFQAEAPTVAKHGNISEALAEQMIGNFRRTTPVLQQWISRMKQHGRQHRWIATEFGRRRPLDMYFHPTKPDKWREAEGERMAVNCYDSETEALTQRGWVKGFDLTEADVLLTKNPGTGTLEWQKIAALHKFPDYNGPVHRWESKSFSAVTTPEHRWLVDAWEGKGSGRKLAQRIRLSKDFRFGGMDRIHRTGDFEGAEKVKFPDALVELAGWFLTDGYFVRPKHSTAARVGFCQSLRANPEKVTCILKALARLGVKHGFLTDKRTECAHMLASGPIAVWLRRQFPTRLLTPAFLRALTRGQLKLLLDTMVSGDGWRSGKTAFCCKSAIAADSFQMLVTLCGSASSRVYRDMRGYAPKSRKLKNVPRMTGCWVVTILKRHRAQVFKRQAAVTVGPCPVWCPTVPNGFFMVRRRGQVYASGNTPVQGTEADIFKLAAARVYKLCKDRWPGLVRQVLWVHDELDLRIHKSVVDEALPLIKAAMEVSASHWPVPLVVDVGVGTNWSDAKNH